MEKSTKKTTKKEKAENTKETINNTKKTDENSNQKFTIIASTAIIIFFLLMLYFTIQNMKESSKEAILDEPVVHESTLQPNPIDNGVNVVATMNDNIYQNSVWCGTFQLVWNDMVEKLFDGDPIFNNQLDIITNLNKKSFNSNSISDKSYYKTVAPFVKSLKDTINNDIKAKFNETSNVLDDVDFSNAPEKAEEATGYFFYTLLKKSFSYPTPFEDLATAGFNNTEHTCKYFGIKDRDDAYNQVKVLYYNSSSDYAVVLSTKEGDEIVLATGANGSTFSDIYASIRAKENAFTGKTYLEGKDTLMVPELNFKTIRTYSELYGLTAPGKNGTNVEIKNAIQSIDMALNKEGGTVKSEALIMADTTAMNPEYDTSRYFEFNKPFTIFLREKSKNPYFAAAINDISLFSK